MKKRNISLILVICLLVCIFPTIAFASDSSADTAKKSYYENYTAIGDSICAGFSQADYDYNNGFDMTENITNSPEFCYARLVGKRLDSAVYNLEKLACDTGELLDILTDENNEYYSVYRNYIKKSDLITLGIGSNDLAMSTMHSILNCIGGDIADMSTQEVMSLLEPLLTGDMDGMVRSIEVLKGIKLTQEQLQAIQGVLSDESLSVTLEKAYETYCGNFPKVVKKIREINPKAEFAVLNYYNPYKDVNFNWGDISFNTGKVIQVPTDKMNKFALNYCQDKGYLYVDVSDTLTNGADPHPSIVGHAQIAGHILDALLNTITAAAQTGGTITPAGENIVKSGESLTFTIAAASGYEISDVLVDGRSAGAVNTYTFTDVKGNHSITASFRRVEGTMHYKTYSALGDSITAGFGLPDYKGDFSNPEDCYVAVAAKDLGTDNNYNLALSAYATKDLLDILQDPSNKYYARFRSSLQDSDLISVDIGSNDLTMTLLDMVLECLGMDLDNMTVEERYTLILSLLNGAKPDSLPENPEDYFGQNITEDQKTAILEALMTENIDARFTEAYEKFTKNWEEIITAIREINPDADLAAIGYYNSNPDLNFEYNGATYYIGQVNQKYIDKMNSYISEKSASAGKYVYVDTTGVELNCFDPHPSKAGHAEIAARLVNALLNIHKRVTSVSLNKTTDSLTVGETDTLTATVNPSDAENKAVVWSSSNASVAAVDSTGKVTAVAAGTADITVTTVDGNKTAVCNVTVTVPVINVTSVSINKTTDTLIVGDTDTLTATVNPSDASNKAIVWSSSNTTVAAVDSTGKVTVVAAGAAIITVTTVDGNKTAVCSVTVVKANASVLPQTGSAVDTDTLTLSGLITLLAGIAIIRFRKKEI
ncbi:MAG: Ig-like domain-containing protein [Bacillota bacterium]|nr:Ig-like domain-containing protein [Bacillota bacterium]